MTPLNRLIVHSARMARSMAVAQTMETGHLEAPQILADSSYNPFGDEIWAS